MGQINSYTEKTTPDGTDEYLLQETGAGTVKKITHSSFLKSIGLTINGFVGLNISNDTDTDHDINITAGRCRDSTGVYDLILASEMTKQIDASWAAGDDAGGLDAGSVAADTWYYFWLIMKDSDNSIDVLISSSATSPTLPSGYTYKRRIRHAVLTDGSANIIGFTKKDNYLWFNSIQEDIDDTSSTTRQVATVSVPPDMIGMFVVSLLDTGGSHAWIQNVNFVDVVPSFASGDISTLSTSTTNTIHKNILVDSSSQIAYRGSATRNGFVINTIGFIDPAES